MNSKFHQLFILLVAFTATTVFAACGDDDDNTGSITVSGLKVTPTSLSFANAGGTQTVSAQSEVQASAKSSADWCVVGQAEGNTHYRRCGCQHYYRGTHGNHHRDGWC